MVYATQVKYTYNPDTGFDFNDNVFLSNASEGELRRIIKVGIQALPGVKFTFNNWEDVKKNNMAIHKATNMITIGNTGIFELDLINIGVLICLTFDKESADKVYQAVDEKYRTDIIIDFLYEKL